MQDLTNQDLREAPLSQGELLEISYKSFQSLIRRGDLDMPLFCLFVRGMKTSSRVCKAVREVLDHLAPAFPDCRFLCVNTQKYFQAAIDYSILSPPTTLALFHGVELSRIFKAAGHGLDYMEPDVKSGLPVVQNWMKETLTAKSFKIFASREEAKRADSVPGVVGLQRAACPITCP